MQQRNGPDNSTIIAEDYCLPLSSDFFTQHPEENSYNFKQSPSAIVNHSHAWTTRHSADSSSNSRKRRRSGGEDDGQPPKKHKTEVYCSPKEPETVLLPCHFHIYDPSRYSVRASDRRYKACAEQWNSLAHLKEHLARKHYIAPHCSVYELNFSSEILLENHYHSARLHPRDESPTEGINDLQMQRIKECLGPGDTSTETDQLKVAKWFEIWMILFPGSQIPNIPSPPEFKFGARPSRYENERIERTWWHGRPLDIEPNSTAPITIQDYMGYETDLQDDSGAVNSSEMSITPSLISNTASAASTFFHCEGRLGHITPELPWLADYSYAELTSAIGLELLWWGQKWTEPSHNSLISTDDWPYYPGMPTSIIGDLHVEDLKLEGHQVNISGHEITCSQTEFDEASMPSHTPFDGDRSKTSQEMEKNEVVITNDPLFKNQVVQVIDSLHSSDNQASCGETAKGSTCPKDCESLNFDYSLAESELSAEYNVDRWLEEPVDPFEVKKRALVETLASDPGLATFALPLFESQWRLESLALSPGVVSCPRGGTPAQTYTASASQSSTGKRKAQAQRSRNSQSDPALREENEQDEDEEEEEEEENPQPKRLRGEDGPTDRKFGCPFHKRLPTIYCLSKDPNMKTKEQKKWAICGGQGFPHLRHLIDHLKKHQIFDCSYCFEPFDDASQYIRHIGERGREGATCTGTRLLQGPGRPGIEPRQWDAITDILKKWTTKSYTDIDKWMDIWKVIFPNVGKPRDPWSSEVDETVQLPASSFAIESLIERLRTLIRAKIKEPNEFIFHKESFDLYEGFLRKALEMESLEKTYTVQNATSMPTPVSSSNAPGTPFSAQGSSFDGVLTPHPRNASSSVGRMLPPVVPPSPRSARSPSHASSPSVQVPISYAAASAPDVIRGQAYQNTERNQVLGAASALPGAHYSSYSPQCQPQRDEEHLPPPQNAQGHSRLDQNAPQVPTASSNPLYVAQPAVVNQQAIPPDITSRAMPRNQPANSQDRNTYYDQSRNNTPDQMASQRTNMVPQFPEDQAELAQVGQMASQIFAILSKHGIAIPSSVPPTPTQASLIASFQGQLNQSLGPPQQQAGETNGDVLQSCQRMDSNNSPQALNQFNTQWPPLVRNASMSQGHASPSGMKPPQPFPGAAPRSPSHSYYHPRRADHFIPSSQNSPQSFNNALGHEILTSQPEALASLGQQFQMQPPQHHVPDSNDLDCLLENDPDEMSDWTDRNIDWDDVFNSANNGIGMNPLGEPGEGRSSRQLGRSRTN